MASQFHVNYRGVGKLLRSPAMGRGMVAHATRVAVIARATAPRGREHDASDGKRFAESFDVKVRQRPDRVVAILSNDDPAALSIEYGTRHTPEHKTIRLAILQAQAGS